jgi:hypothetical protein
MADEVNIDNRIGYLAIDTQNLIDLVIMKISLNDDEARHIIYHLCTGHSASGTLVFAGRKHPHSLQVLVSF